MNPPQDVRGQDLRVLDVAAVPLRRWRMVAATTATALAAALLGLLVKQDAYEAVTVLVSSQDDVQADLQWALLGAQLPLSLKAMGMQPAAHEQRVEAILESRTLADSVIRRVDLIREWEAAGVAEAREMLARRTEIDATEEGSIRINVRDPDARLAARIANAYPEALNAISVAISTRIARQRENFLVAQHEQTRLDLEAAEDQMVKFQRGHGAPAVEQQSEATIQAAALLERQILETELEVARLRRFATPENPRLREAQTQLAALRSQLGRLTSGGGRRGDVFFSFPEAPELSVDFNRVARDFAEQEQIYTSLTAALAEARIDAAKNLPVVTVLDPAVIPHRPSGTPLLVVLFGLGFLGLFLGLISAFGVEWWEIARSDEKNTAFFQAWRTLKIEVRSPVRGGKSSGPDSTRRA